MGVGHREAFGRLCPQHWRIIQLKAIRISQKIATVVALHNQQTQYNSCPQQTIQSFAPHISTPSLSSIPAPSADKINTNKIYRIWNLVIFAMLSRDTNTNSFIQQMNLQLREYQFEKAIKMQQRASQPTHQENIAKQTLIELDQQSEQAEDPDQDVCVGRWSNYKVPLKVEERMSLPKKARRNSLNAAPAYRYLDYPDRGYFPTLCRSEKTIPKLKIILHQLECPLNLSSQRKSTRVTSTGNTSKMRNHIGMEALVISNKQEIKPTLKSQRKTTALATDLLSNNENRRPPSSHFKGQPASSSYQKIKRTIGSNQECELIYQKQILSQLIKGALSKPPPKDTPNLSSMLNFFTKTGGTDTKRKVSAKLGLDKLLC